MKLKIQRPEVLRVDEGEERLQDIVSEAGDEARRRKQEAMASHYARIRAVVAQAAARSRERFIA
jgi:hypothetical protein